MNLPRADILRAAIMASLNAFFPILTMFSIVDWTGEQLAVVSTFVTTVVTLGFLFYPNKTQ